MNRLLVPGLAAGAILALAACQPPTLYRWGNYDEALYSHYKKPQEREAFVSSLKEIVLGAEQEGRKAPPGCYAEYGYALYEEGQYQSAIAYYTKERDQWPESQVLVQKLIASAERMRGNGRKAISPAAVVGPAGRLEAK